MSEQIPLYLRQLTKTSAKFSVFSGQKSYRTTESSYSSGLLRLLRPLESSFSLLSADSDSQPKEVIPDGRSYWLFYKR